MGQPSMLEDAKDGIIDEGESELGDAVIRAADWRWGANEYSSAPVFMRLLLDREQPLFFGRQPPLPAPDGETQHP